MNREPCRCYIPLLEGHDYACRQHPRFKKRKPITDSMRLNKLLKSVYPFITRQDIDAMIRAERKRR